MLATGPRVGPVASLAGRGSLSRVSAPSTYVGLDLGTSAVKGVLVDADGRTLATAERALELLEPTLLAAEQDPEAWWARSAEVLRDLASAADPARVAGIGLTGQKHALLALDADERPLAPAVLWCDGRATSETEEVHARVDRTTLGRRTGAFAAPGYFLPKWLRLRRRQPDLAARTASFLFAKDWLRLRLTGTKATDRTEASSSLVFDLGRKAWAEDLCRTLDVPIAALPPVVRSSDVTGRVTAGAAAATGLVAGTPVVGGAGDNEAGALACGALGEGVVAVILGTSATIVAGHATRGSAGGIVWGRHATRSGYAATGVVLSSGRALEWIRKAAFSSDFSVEEVVEAAAASDPAEGALVFVPSLAGERSPVPDPGASGAFVGLRPGHGRGHLARAVLEGVALSIAEVLSLLRGAGVPVSDLRLTSGGAASSFFRGLVAAAAGLPVRPMGEAFGPAFGAALLAARGTRRFATLADGVAAWIAPPPPEPPDVREGRAPRGARHDVAIRPQRVALDRAAPAATWRARRGIVARVGARSRAARRRKSFPARAFRRPRAS